MSKYIILLILSGIIPLVLSFWPPLKFYRNKRALILSITLIVVIFGGWDIFAVWRGHWSFNPAGVGRSGIFNLPLEEWLFFIVIPFCSIFTWEALKFIKGKIR